MLVIFDRREVLGGGLALAGLIVSGCSARSMASDAPDFASQLRGIESASGGILGVEFFDTASGRSIGINRDMRFGHCSSFKLSLAAMILARDANGEDSADRHVKWTKDDLMFVSPFTEKRVDEGATLRELAEFTQKYSDNAAANILLREVGGPEALTAFWRSLGDDVSRLDRYEPALNAVPPGEVRDTTTPAAMARTVAKLVYGDALPQEHRAALRQWMVDTPTGLRRVRAGLTDNWVAGDKTGTGLMADTAGIYVDIGFVEPPESAPLTFATYFRPPGSDNSFDRANEAPLAQVGAVLAEFATL